MLSCQKACNAVWDRKCAKRRTYHSWRALLCWQHKQAWRHHGTDFWLRGIQTQGTCIHDCTYIYIYIYDYTYMTARAPPHCHWMCRVDIWLWSQKWLPWSLSDWLWAAIVRRKFARHWFAAVALLVLWTWWWENNRCSWTPVRHSSAWWQCASGHRLILVQFKCYHCALGICSDPACRLRLGILCPHLSCRCDSPNIS